MAEPINAPELLNDLDGSGSDKEFCAINELRKLGNELPKLLLEKYRTARKWQVRSSCVYHSIRYARSSSEAVELGVIALVDKSHAVRYRACMLLAYSLDKSVLSSLKQLENSTSHEETLLDVRAAIDAIENQNSDYFVDRDHSGNMTLRVN
ncbi:hypothetical protein P2G88_01095 [Aliiglaciecola sp. CAU 1673]|uniref:hypothetical protein n=1 Tax=Aliiglaciecola sp. CAU 1673 TaxID=3032595 RepID=UPI0023DABBB3|nr:hypothetical protein [Aliiglaciecola sp. CAU 1673]MDF2176846.1 hypothetical protein [Aliiglaciecola sp. CAU 1673]